MINGLEHLPAHTLGGVHYAHMVVANAREEDAIRTHVDARAVPSSRVSYVERGVAVQGRR